MSTQVTITLPDDVYQRAKNFARLANRDIDSILADTIQSSMPPVREDSINLDSVSDLTDEQVIALADLQMEPHQDLMLSELLDRQQAGTITEDERTELQSLMQIYQEGMVRKSSALVEAVQRGLMKPLS